MEATTEITAAVKNVPALRFQEFEEEWKERRLSDGVKLISGQHLGPEDYNKNEDGIPYFTGPSDFTDDNEVVTKWTNNSKHFGHKGDALITVKGSGVGTMALLRLNKVAMGRQLMAIKSGHFNSGFIYHFLLTKSRLFVALASGNMIPGLSRQDILTLKLKVPTIVEQQKIASFLTIVDDKIKQLSQKKALLEKYKKGVMQQIFSQQIRFKDENGNAYPEWEVRKLGEVCNSIVSGKTKPETQGNFPVYGSTGIIGRASSFSHDGKYLLIARVGANAGQINTAHGKFSVTDNTLIIDVSKDANVDFIYYYLLLFNLNKLVFGSGQPLITGGQLKSLKINLPKLSEQVKIANFLISIDNKLNQTYKQLEQAQQFKKGLLQQLFV